MVRPAGSWRGLTVASDDCLTLFGAAALGVCTVWCGPSPEVSAVSDGAARVGIAQASVFPLGWPNISWRGFRLRGKGKEGGQRIDPYMMGMIAQLPPRTDSTPDSTASKIPAVAAVFWPSFGRRRLAQWRQRGRAGCPQRGQVLGLSTLAHAGIISPPAAHVNAWAWPRAPSVLLLLSSSIPSSLAPVLG